MRPRLITRDKHAEAVRFFNRLIIDLKKKLAGIEHDPITEERLNEASRHISDIQACKENCVIRHTVVWDH